MSLEKKRWQVLIASCLINLCTGSLYAWSVFATPMAERINSLTGAGISSLSIVFTIANLTGPVTMIIGGFLNNKYGPKKVILIGGIIFGIGMATSGFAKSVGMLILTYGLGVGLGNGTVYGCTVSNSVKFFPDKKGLVGGLTTASFGISSVIVPPIANMLTDKFGIVYAFLILGIIMLVIICVCDLFIVACPAGYIPEGWSSEKRNAKSPADKNWKQMLSDPIFYVMILMLCCGAFSGLMIVSQASPLAQRLVNMTPAAAAVVVSVLALFNTLGRILAGFASDKIGTVNTLKAVFVLSIVGLLSLGLFGSANVVVFYAGICLVGLTFGSIMGIYPGFTSYQFGSKNNSVNYGILFVGFAVAGYFGPTIMTSLYNSSGNDKTAFLIATGLGFLGLILAFVYNSLNKKRIKEQ